MRLNLLPFTTALFLFLAPQFRAQSSYLSLYCAYPANYEMASAFTTQNTPGTLCFGYNSFVNVNGTWNDNKNFCIMGSGSSNIMVTYKTYLSHDCNSPATQIVKQNGLSAVETTGPSGIRYAVAGVHETGIYFVALDPNGSVIGQRSYPFSLEKSANYKRPGKPKIIEAEMVGAYYICGSYDSDLYVLKVDANGNILWSSYYTLLGDTKPRDMILDPFNPGRLLIIGTTNEEKKDNEGFLLGLQVGNGAVINCNLYGRAIGYDSFNTISVAHDQQTNTADGFIIGGYQHPLSSGEPSAWILKLDQTLGVIWSNGIYTSTGINKGYVDIVERLNTAGQYEFYGLLESSAGMQVTKLNHQGAPFTSPLTLNFNGFTLPKNEFIYEVPTLTPSKATSLSYVNSFVNGGPDVGLQVFGNSYFTPGLVGTYQVNSYFNGETNCYRTLTTLPGYKEAAFEKNSLAVRMHDLFTECHNFMVQAIFISSPLTLLCGGPSINGSNLRPMRSDAASEEALTREENTSLQVFPNPASEKTNLRFYVNENSQAQVDVFDMVGRLVYSHQVQCPANGGELTEEINFGQLGLPEGMYVLALTANGSLTQQKLVYRK